MQIFNTLTRRKDPLPEPAKGKPLRLFVCGPTVYDYIHIGNARTFAVFDTLARWLRHRGVRVTYLQNITDIDDKIIVRAQKENVSPLALARRYEREFKRNAKALRLLSVDRYARATAHIKEIVRQVQTLIKKGHAYEIPNEGWYFDVTAFPDYGKLARRTVAQAEDGISRIDESVRKRNRADFVLWKYSKQDEPSWNSPLGKGRPGWHIEDTAITEKYFGPQYEIHGAGVDLMFPHHEAEIAQQESASGKKPMVQVWMHAEFVVMGDEKMSKSKGNFLTAREFLATHSANAFRLIVAQHHYRTRIPFTPALIAQAEQTLGGVEEFFAKLELIRKQRSHHHLDSRFPSSAQASAGRRGNDKRGGNDAREGIAKAEKVFRDAMEDDLNTPKALAALFDFMAAANPRIWELSRSETKAAMEFLQIRLDLLGIELQPLKIPLKIKALVRSRELSRRSQQFTHSDRLRGEIESLGYRVEDTPAGPLVLRKPEARIPNDE